jgi:hypothetical protein
MIVIERPESADQESQRAEMQALPDSKDFKRAPTLANLQSHL